MGACRIDVQIQPGSLGAPAEYAFSSRGAADIAHADE
jgi:hypothetical protein